MAAGLPQRAEPRQESLHVLLLVVALASVVGVAALLGASRDKVAMVDRPPLTENERGRLPRFVDVAGGLLAVPEPGAPIAVAPFRLARQEVTVEQFRMFIRRTGYTNPSWKDFPCVGGAADLSWDEPGYEQADTYPVVCVSARDAAAFAAWLAAETGAAVRLPTEQEWELAARAGSRTRYWWGEDYDARYADCMGCGPRSPAHPTYVGARPANALGLRDVAGNVREWTCSPYAPAGIAPPGSVSAVEVAARCAGAFDESLNLVVRGGSWQEPMTALQPGDRGPFGAWHRNVWTGFRVAADGVEPAPDAAGPRVKKPSAAD